MRALLALLVLSQLAAANFLEIRKVVEAGKGSKTYDDPRKAEDKITVSDDVVITERHLEEAWVTPMRDQWQVAINLTAEGEQRMIAATKDAIPGVTRMAMIIDGKLNTAPAINSVPLGKSFVITAESQEEARELAEKLRAAGKKAAAAVAPGSFEIRRVVEAGQGTLKVKLRKTDEELTLSDTVIVNRRDLATFWKLPGQAQHEIMMRLTDEGTKRMEEATKDTGSGKLRLAILIDGQAVTAPVVQRGPLGKDFAITFGDKEDDKKLAEEIVEKLKKAEK